MRRPFRALPPATQRVVASVVQVSFVVAAVGFAWWALSDDWDEITAAVRSIGPSRWFQAAVLVAFGTAISGFAWQRMLGGFGHRLPLRRSMAILLVGQLGKYIPGSVWTLGAQAALARRAHVPVRVALVTGLVFIGWNFATAVVIGGTGLLAGAVDADVPVALAVVAVVGGVVAVTPLVVNWLGTRMNRAGHVLTLTWTDTAFLSALFAVTWLCFGLAITRLAVGGDEALGVATAVTAFTISYAVGLAVVIAPAGLGAREVTLAFLLAPTIGTPAATAVAVASRLTFTVVDVALAFGAWTAARRLVADPPTPPGASAAPSPPDTGHTG